MSKIRKDVGLPMGAEGGGGECCIIVACSFKSVAMRLKVKRKKKKNKPSLGNLSCCRGQTNEYVYAEKSDENSSLARH